MFVRRAVDAALGAVGKGSSATVRVATYNVLSPNLGAPGYFIHCDPEALVPETRLQGVLAQLQPEVDAGAVIGLQEVALKWVGPLQVWLAERNYRFVQTNYGSDFSGYMGVGIAYPMGKYKLLDLDICRMRDTKRWPKEPEKEPGIGGRVLQVVTPVAKVVWSPVSLARRLLLGPPKREPTDPWTFSSRRYNQALSARLQCVASGASFWVSTYHMPCAFFLPPAMVIHVALAVQNIAALAEKHGEPFVLCGDFNIKPGDATYELITSGCSLPEGHPELPEPREWDSWLPTVPKPMKSAYFEVNGSEPDFTNFAQTKKDEQPFIACLDYIFISEECTSMAVRQLPARSEVDGPFPTLKEPSDHMLIAATITIPHV